MIESQRNNSTFAKWLNSVDQVSLAIILILMAFSAVMSATASPAVADRIGVPSFYFVKRQLVYLCFAFIIIAVVSSLSKDTLIRFSILSYFIFFLLLILVHFYGNEYKGARRWISILGFSLQPSEFIKPLFAVVTAWVLARSATIKDYPSFQIAIGLYIVTILLIIIQPDFGMAITLSCIWGGQLIVAGLSLFWVFGFLGFALLGFLLAFFSFPHVAERINKFLDPKVGENYQVTKSIEAYTSGGIFGKGPGEGTVKQVLPDSHTDFIFAVIGEEFGMIVSIFLICMILLFVIRNSLKILQLNDPLVVYSSSGIIIQFAFQSFVNIGVTLNLLPTKGMTLPFLSYGGSSMFATALAVGILLALTKKRFGIYRSNIHEELILLGEKNNERNFSSSKTL